MKIKYMIISLSIIIFIIVLDNTYAFDDERIYTDNKLDITLEYDSETFNEEVYKFIDLIDDSLIPTSSFNMSDKLNENYDFLTVFAINFILNNEKYYENDIVIGNEYSYNGYVTNKYIDLNIIYDITNNILGKSDYYILNDYLKIENNLVPLLLIKDYNFSMQLEEIIDIIQESNNYKVLVKYKDLDIIYEYQFELFDERLIISNISIGEVL